MKKLFLFLAMASTTLFVSCGSDDSDNTTPAGATAITLTTSVSTVAVNAPVTLTVKNNLTPAVDVTSSSAFTITPATGATISAGVFTATVAGSYSIVATNGTLTSTPVVVVVTAAPVATSITLVASSASVQVGQQVNFTVTDNLGNNVTGASTFTSNGTAFTGPFTSNVAGTYNIIAKYGELSSTAVAITVTETTTNPAGDNSIFINGENNTIENSMLVYWGGWAADPDATEATHILWSLVSFDTGSAETATNYVDVEFVGPLPTGQLALPVSSEVDFNQVYQVVVGGAEIELTSTESGTITFDAWPAAINQPHSFAVTAQYNGGSSMEVNFDGNWLGAADGTAERPAQRLNKAKAAKNVKVISKAELAQIKAKFFANLKK